MQYEKSTLVWVSVMALIGQIQYSYGQIQYSYAKNLFEGYHMNMNVNNTTKLLKPAKLTI